MDDAAKKIQKKRAKIEAHHQAGKERAEAVAHLKASYTAEKDSVVVKDILAKAKTFAAYHTKIAQDGVGAQKTGHKLEDGTAEVENVFFTNDKRISELDKAVGLLELVDYIERQFQVPPTEPEQKAN